MYDRHNVNILITFQVRLNVDSEFIKVTIVDG